LYDYTDVLFKIAYRAATSAAPHAIEILKRSFVERQLLNVVWRDDDDGDAMVVLHRVGSWQDSLRRVAGRSCHIR